MTIQNCTRQKGFWQISSYLLKDLWQITSYLPEDLRQITSYLPANNLFLYLYDNKCLGHTKHSSWKVPFKLIWVLGAVSQLLFLSNRNHNTISNRLETGLMPI